MDTASAEWSSDPIPETGPDGDSGFGDAEVAEIPGSRQPDDDVEMLPQGDARDEEVPELLPLLSQVHGLYYEPFTLELTSPIGYGQLRYTLDGSDPLGDRGRLYVEPLTIETTTVVRAALTVDGVTAVDHATATYLFPDDVPEQEPLDGWPDEWWVDHSEGPFEADYEMDPAVTGSDAWEDAEPELFTDLAIVSIVLDSDDLFGDDGIHEHPEDRGDDWERPASAEMFDANAGSIFTVDCGIQVQGGAGRRPERSPKKSFRLVFKDVYGPGRLAAPLFEDSEVEEFNTFILRAGYTRAWVNWNSSQRSRSTYLHEAYASNLARQMGEVAPQVRPVHLFLNGIYWGLYQLEERPDAAFMNAYLGGGEHDWDVINSGELIDGDTEAWEELMAQIEDGLSDSRDYGDVEDLLDIDRFIDYMLLELVLGNNDWPLKNWWAARERDDDTKWFFIPWDSELIMGDVTDNLVDVADEDTPGEIFQALRANERFVVRFGDRVQKRLFNGGVLSTPNLRETWDEEAERVVPGVIAESARWGDHWRDVRGEDTDLYTYEDHWLAEYHRVMVDEWMPNRIATVIADFQAAGLYPTLGAPVLSPFGGDVSDDDRITLRASLGDVYYTLDGEDPANNDGTIDADAILYTGPFTLDEDATLLARAWSLGEWSALVEAEFEVE